MKTNYLLILLLCIPALVFSQNFKGKVSFANHYLDKQTMKPIAPTIMENVWLSENLQKVVIQKEDSSQTGGIDWQIFNYKTGTLFTKEFYPNAKIVQSKICDEEKEAFSHEVLDTTFNFRGLGLTAKLMIIRKDGKKVAEFYYSNKYKISPAFYACNGGDILNYFYKASNGAFLLQRVEFGDLYTWIYQAKEITAYDVPDKEFALPAK